jgi:uncharacterized membrane protein
MGENHFMPVPVALYGFVLLMNGVAYYILSRGLIAYHGKASTLAVAMGRDYKGQVSVLIYAVAVPLSFVAARISLGLYILVAMMWFIPDRRIEDTLPEAKGGEVS